MDRCWFRDRGGHGHHRHRRHQECGGYGAGRRQLCHHRGCRRRGPPYLRQYPQGHSVPAGLQYERGAGRVRGYATGLYPDEPGASAVHQPHHRLLPGAGAGSGEGGAGRDGAAAPPL